VLCCSEVGGNGAPLTDRQASLSLILELSLQRGRLLHLLRALLLLLRLSDDGGMWDKHFLSTVTTTSSSTAAAAAATCTSGDDKLDDNVTYDNEGKISRAPLVSILRRVGEIPAREIKQYGGRSKKDENSVSFDLLCFQYIIVCLIDCVVCSCVCKL